MYPDHGFSRFALLPRRIALLVSFALLSPAIAPLSGQVGSSPDEARSHEAFLRGLGLEIGNGGSPDFRAAATQYEAAAELGHSGAMVRLGYLAQTGSGVPRDEIRAVALYRAAAELGDPDGRYRLGVALLDGIGVVPNPPEARGALAQAANAGHQESQVMLAILQDAGTGGPKNSYAARRWLGRAEEGPDPELAGEAGKIRERLDQHLLYSSSGVSEAIAAAILVGVGIAVALAAVTPGGNPRPYDSSTYDGGESDRLRRQMQCVTRAHAMTSTVGGMLEARLRLGC